MLAIDAPGGAVGLNGLDRLSMGPEWQRAQIPFVEPGVNSDSMNMRRPRFSEAVVPFGSTGGGPPRAKFSSSSDEKNRLSVRWNSAISASCSWEGSAVFCA